MKIQSLSIVIPIRNCINKCRFCVSKTHDQKYATLISSKMIGENQASEQHAEHKKEHNYNYRNRRTITK
jgi:hypothetical protein